MIASCGLVEIYAMYPGSQVIGFTWNVDFVAKICILKNMCPTKSTHIKQQQLYLEPGCVQRRPASKKRPSKKHRLRFA